MGQLELDLYPYRSKTISKGENQIFSWHDNISEDKDKICYHESVYVKNQGMDLEDWLHIKRQNLGKLTLDYFYSLLKNSKKATKINKKLSKSGSIFLENIQKLAKHTKKLQKN